ncbi:SDR family oxidoreductase [Pseudomonas costantinii]|uniref:NAD(P)-dependent dehydrogenase, short-chain alcohol dehydrogenase family n=1 Tax=Pseudomonas costantinii TaxID=168469 RepID=A0A1S2V6U5_9PSED|nr:SDR family oxidoreductase [Pseudomonas costantinii]NVZ19470.1 SDR family oxidoreductase [Pseudomonas costantinii]OIN53688.1 short-chain dehydrogenase [Pseudomonas costantinii]SEE32442.1 NAD(P)-dependent dehydrogenase, short-chain alcohol dehydrogenase family [Pseudomonas costantinii]
MPTLEPTTQVLVIGGSAGIGFAIARLFHQQGATVTLAGRSAARLSQAAQDIGPNVATVPLDVTQPAELERFFAHPTRWNHIVVTAASLTFGPLRSVSLKDAQRIFDSKFWAAYHIARLASFDAQGSLTLISGRFAQRAGPQTALISAVNACVEGLARGLASELSPVRVNVLSPGFVDTGMHPEALVQKMRQRSESLPVKRIARPEDIASAALLLATNSMISGTVLTVDGGDTVTFT